MSEELIKQLLQDISNEKSTDFILPYKPEPFETLKKLVDDQVQQFQEQMDKIKEGNGPDLSQSQIMRRIHQAQELELLRIKYMLRAYIKARFDKISKYIERGIAPDDSNLSKVELQFVNNITAAMIKNQGPATLEFTPENEVEIDHGFVFFKALNNRGAQSLSEGSSSEPIDIVKDQIYFARYDSVEHLYRTGDIFFI